METSNVYRPRALPDAPYTLSLVSISYLFTECVLNEYQNLYPILALNDDDALLQAQQALETEGLAAAETHSVGFLIAREEVGAEPRVVAVRYIVRFKSEEFGPMSSSYAGFLEKSQEEMLRTFEGCHVSHRNILYGPEGFTRNKIAT